MVFCGKLILDEEFMVGSMLRVSWDVSWMLLSSCVIVVLLKITVPSCSVMYFRKSVCVLFVAVSLMVESFFLLFVK